MTPDEEKQFLSSGERRLSGRIPQLRRLVDKAQADLKLAVRRLEEEEKLYEIICRSLEEAQ